MGGTGRTPRPGARRAAAAGAQADSAPTRREPAGAAAGARRPTAGRRRDGAAAPNRPAPARARRTRRQRRPNRPARAGRRRRRGAEPARRRGGAPTGAGGEPAGSGRERRLDALEAGEQRAHRGVDLRRGRLHDRQLELGARLGAGLDGLERLGEQLEHAHDGGGRHACRLIAERGVELGRHGQLRGNGPERLDDEQLAGAGLEVAQERAGVAAALDAALDGEHRASRVAGGDRVEGLREQLGVHHAEHREHVGQRDLLAAVGDELLERAERVAEAAGGRARDRRRGLGGSTIESACAARRTTLAI